MSPDTLSLSGKIAIVTGSGHVSDSVAPRAAAVAQRVEELGGKATVVQVDMSTPEGAARLVDETCKAFGVDRIDILGTTQFVP